MKLVTLRSLSIFSVSLAFATNALATPAVGIVRYTPLAATVQGNQPLNKSYLLTVTGPANLPGGSTANVALNLRVVSMPVGGTAPLALSFISVSPSVLTFTGPNQKKTTTVTVVVPLGNNAGSYAYKITTSGWPPEIGTVTDGGAAVNAIVSPPSAIDTTPPAITLLSPQNLTAYTYQPASGNPVTVPVDFSASVGTNGAPIDTMLASIATPTQTIPVGLTTSVLPSLSATATGSVQLTAPGRYTVTVAAGNANGTSYASSTVSVTVDAPPPSITVASPTGNSTFSYTLGGAGASVPVSFSATSIYGNITSLSATLDGNPVTLTTSGVGAATLASGSATLTVAATGSHSLVLAAANDFGPATPVTVPFTVTGIVPAPTVAVLSPASGSAFARAAGDPPTVVNYSFQGGTTYGTIVSASVTLDGIPVTALPVLTGLNTASLAGSGALSFSAGGSHTLNVTVVNSGGAMASASTSFTIHESQPQLCEDLTWLPPISLNKTVEGGAKVPIKFTLECRNKFIRDTSVLIAIYEVFRNGSTSTPTIHHYGTGSPNPPDYAIQGKQYHLNFTTAKGTHSYQVEVYTPVAGSMRLLGTHEVNTQGSGGKGDGHDERGEHGDDGDHDGRDDDRGHN